MSQPGLVARVALLTGTALCSFAANSLLCRAALRGGSIDASAFTVVRLIAGAVLLTVFARRSASTSGDWASGALLAVYAAAFSFAYLGLSAGTGALLLFGSVQATMLGVGIARREHPGAMEWTGLALGLGGLVWLLLPGLKSPPLFPALLMVAAGAAWGAYSLRGRAQADPVATTAGNFLRAAVLSLPLLAFSVGAGRPEGQGLLLAVVSGAVTSGLGYVAWYAALRDLPSSKAAIVQLSVPVLAAAAGVVFLSEVLTLRLLTAGIFVLGGVSLALTARRSDTRTIGR